MKPPRPLVPHTVGVLEPLVDAGVLGAAEIAVADAVARLSPSGCNRATIQAVAVAALARRLGHSCVDLARAAELCAAAADEGAADAELPDPKDWVEALVLSDVVQISEPDDVAWGQPLVLDAERGRLWLARYAHYERVLRDRLVALAKSEHRFADNETIAAAVDAAFASSESSGDAQRAAVSLALQRRLSFVVGGPGTGKTWTVGRLLDAYGRLDPSRPAGSVALAAPTGKAAERLSEAVGGMAQATTIHRLLGLRPDTAVGVDPPRELPHSLIVIDEASMIDLAMMTRLVGAVAAEAHLVFVGDPDQLLSVEVGSVLRDVVDAAVVASSPLHGTVTELERSHRFAGDLAELAETIRRGDGKAAVDLLSDPTKPGLTIIDPGDRAGIATLEHEATMQAAAILTAARQGDAAEALGIARSHKVLAAIRAGRFGLDWWNGRISVGIGLRSNEWTVGRPVIVTRNDAANGVFNGDTGVVVPDPADSTGLRVALAGSDEPRLIAPSRLRNHEDWWAMTIHKSQGSEFDHIVVSLPEVPSAILSRELLYTAVTRAKSHVTIVGKPDVVRATAEHRVERASGLRDRLSGGS